MNAFEYKGTQALDLDPFLHEAIHVQYNQHTEIVYKNNPVLIGIP